MDTDNILELNNSSNINIKRRVMLVTFMFVILLIILYLCYLADLNSMTPQHLISIGLDFSALIGVTVLTLVYSLDRAKPVKSTVLFYFLLVCDYIGLCAYILGWLVEEKNEYIIYNYITSTVNFVVSPIICFVFWNYQNFVYSRNAYAHKKTAKLLFGLCIADILYIILNLWFGYLFIVDESGNYTPRIGYLITLIYPVSVLVSCFITNIKRPLPYRKKISLIAFCITPIISSITTVYFQEYTYTYVIVFFVLMLMYGTIQLERNLEMSKQREELMEKRTQIMLSQMQPHFVSNTLGMIRSMYRYDVDKAEAAMNTYISYLQKNFSEFSSVEPIAANKELEHAREYSELAQLRWPDMEIIYDIKTTNFRLPAMTIQPLLENSIRHGLMPLKSGGRVVVSMYEEEGNYIVKVEDNGVGFNVDNPMPRIDDYRKHIGLDNIRDRLNMMSHGSLYIESIIDKGTTVTVRIPKEN